MTTYIAVLISSVLILAVVQSVIADQICRSIKLLCYVLHTKKDDSVYNEDAHLMEVLREQINEPAMRSLPPGEVELWLQRSLIKQFLKPFIDEKTNEPKTESVQ